MPIDRKMVLLYLGIVLWAVAAIGCTGRFLPVPVVSETVQDEHLVIVTVTAQDTLESLAQTYLGDRDKAFWIAEHNGIQRAQAGQRLVIPLKPITLGIGSDGYQTLPVLLYPKISEKEEAAGEISIQTFARQMQFLKENGYRPVGLDRLDGFLNLTDRLHPKSLIISFDSAESWVYDLAYPVLKGHGFTAAVFVATGQIGKSGHLTWQQLAAMADDGFDIGVSGVSARNWIDSPPGADGETYIKALEDQISQPQKIIAEKLKKTCRYFAYPGGRANDAVIALLRRYGYRCAFTQERGGNPFFTDSYLVRRNRIGGPAPTVPFERSLDTFTAAELK